MLANSFTIMRHPPELVEYLESLAKRNVAFINSALTHGGFLVGGKFFDYREIDPSGEEIRLKDLPFARLPRTEAY